MILEFNQSKFLSLFSNINDLYVKGKISDEYLAEKFDIVCQMFGNKRILLSLTIKIRISLIESVYSFMPCVI